jgi:outer membrane protein
MRRRPVLLAVLVTFSASGAAAQTLPAPPANAPVGTVARVAYFSPQRAFAESPDGKAAETRLSTLQADKERAVAEKTKAIQAEEQALESGATVLSQAVLLQRGKQLEKLKIDVQRYIEDAQTELTSIQREIQTAFLAKLTPAVEQVAKERNLQFVLNADQGTIVWADPSFDITSEVIQRMAVAAAQPGR